MKKLQLQSDFYVQEKSYISKDLERDCELCRIIWMQRISMHLTQRLTDAAVKN